MPQNLNDATSDAQYATTVPKAAGPEPVAPAASPLPGDIVKLRPEEAVSALVHYALSLPASDLFITAGEKDCAVLVRSLGVLRSVATVPAEIARRWTAHVKATAGMDITEKRRPLDGRWVYRRAGQSPVDIRLSTIPTLYGEDLAMRLLDLAGAQYELNSLGLLPSQYDEVVLTASNPGGLILVSGPTGAGKTATLYALLRHLNDGRRKINTIEDPVEYAIPGLRQTQVMPQIKLGFADLLRAVMRQAPDVIMIGEIRDEETAHTAVAAANSGHLVLATIHAANAALAPQSLRGLGVPAQLLAYSLRCVIAQRLARTLCPACKKSYSLEDMPQLFDEVRSQLHPGEGATLCAPVGCEACRNTGFTGRTGVFEILPVQGAVRTALAAGETPGQLRKRAVAMGMLEFRQTALLKVAAGITSTDEVFRVLPAENLLSGMMDD